MDNKRPDTISYYEHEAEIARAEVNAKRWALAALIAFVSLSADICISKLKRSARK